MSEFLKPLVQTASLLQTVFLPPFVFHGAVVADSEAIRASADELPDYIRNPLLDPQKKLAALQAKMESEGVKLE